MLITFSLPGWSCGWFNFHFTPIKSYYYFFLTNQILNHFLRSNKELYFGESQQICLANTKKLSDIQPEPLLRPVPPPCPVTLETKGTNNTLETGVINKSQSPELWLIDQCKWREERRRNSRQIRRLTRCVSWMIQLWRETERAVSPVWLAFYGTVKWHTWDQSIHWIQDMILMFSAALLMHVRVFIWFIECIMFIKDSSSVHKK